jgi:hypothetical protein
MKTDELTVKMCTTTAQRVLLGRTIKKVRYMTEKEANHLMWNKRPLVIELDNGTIAYFSMDDEGNDGGSLFYLDNVGKGWDVIPTL